MTMKKTKVKAVKPIKAWALGSEEGIVNAWYGSSGHVLLIAKQRRDVVYMKRTDDMVPRDAKVIPILITYRTPKPLKP